MTLDRARDPGGAVLADVGEVVTELLFKLVVGPTGVAASATIQQQPECTLRADVKVSKWSLP